MAQGLIVKIKNNSGAALLANKAVYVTGFDEDTQQPTVGLASYTSENTLPSIGITIDQIEDGSSGAVRTSGILTGFDTSSVNINDGVYIGSNGGIVFAEPSVSNYIIQQMGVIVTSEENGQILLFPMEIRQGIPHPELEEVLEDQHHPKLHVNNHAAGGIDELDHGLLKNVTEDQHHPKLHASDHAFGAVDDLSSVDVMYGTFLENISLSAHVANDIPHGLGRKLERWEIVKRPAARADFEVTLIQSQNGTDRLQSGIWGKVLYGTYGVEKHDNGGNFASDKFTAPHDGLYQFSANAYIHTALPDGTLYAHALRKNGSTWCYGGYHYVGLAGGNPMMQLIHMSARLSAGDYIEHWVYQNGGSLESLGGHGTVRQTTFEGRAIDELGDGQDELSAANQETYLRLYSSMDRTVSISVG